MKRTVAYGLLVDELLLCLLGGTYKSDLSVFKYHLGLSC